MTLDEFEVKLAAIIGRPSLLRPFVCEGSPLDCDILLVGFNPKTPMPADYWSFWRNGYGFDKTAFERAYEAKRLADGQSGASNTREVMRRLARGASGCRIVEANLYPKNSENERELAKSDRDLRPFHLLLSAIQPRVVVPFGRFAKQEFVGMQVNCPVEPVKHFSRGWGHDAAEAFGAKLAALGQPPQAIQLATRAAQEGKPRTKASDSALGSTVLSLVGDGAAIREAARGLDLILKDSPDLCLKVGSSQISIWLCAENQSIRLFRLKRDSTKADLLVHINLVNQCPRAEKIFDLALHKNPDFRRFFDDSPENTRAMLSAVRKAASRIV